MAKKKIVPLGTIKSWSDEKLNRLVRQMTDPANIPNNVDEAAAKLVPGTEVFWDAEQKEGA
jgi:hypothetical protein